MILLEFFLRILGIIPWLIVLAFYFLALCVSGVVWLFSPRRSWRYVAFGRRSQNFYSKEKEEQCLKTSWN